MQLKLLNFHKALANFSTNLVGAFIPLIVYQKTNSMVYALLYLVCTYFFYVMFTLLLRKWLEKKPQLFLLLRIFPIVIYSLSILLIDVNVFWGSAMVCVFCALSDTFKSNSNEIILNYSSLNKGSNTLGLTRVFEQLGIIVAVICGGLFLDYLNQFILIALALGIYFISVIPLLIYYIKFRKSKSFNKEAISNAYLAYSQNEVKTKAGKKLSRKIIFQYFLIYLLFNFLDTINNAFSLYLFTTSGLYSVAGYITAVFNACIGFSSYIVGKLNEKHDLTWYVCAASIIAGICVVLLPFIPNIYVIYGLFVVIGICYPFFSIFLLERLLAKARILGISNRALFARNNSSIGRCFVFPMGMFGTLIPIFVATCIALVIMGVYIPINEEQTRKELVNYLERSD